MLVDDIYYNNLNSLWYSQQNIISDTFSLKHIYFYHTFLFESTHQYSQNKNISPAPIHTNRNHHIPHTSRKLHIISTHITLIKYDG